MRKVLTSDQDNKKRKNIILGSTTDATRSTHLNILGFVCVACANSNFMRISFINKQYGTLLGNKCVPGDQETRDALS
jgi:hypothetical protein